MTMKRSEIWLVDLNPTRGAEMQKIHPTVIVSNDAVGILPLKVSAPITEWKDWHKKMPWMVPLAPDSANGLSKPSSIDTFQIRSVSQDRFVKRLGELPEEVMQEIVRAVSLVLNIKS